jgi:hypothetical protein
LESCRLLGEENLLLRLNSLLGTDYGMSEEIQDALDFCISRNYDTVAINELEVQAIPSSAINNNFQCSCCACSNP